MERIVPVTRDATSAGHIAPGRWPLYGSAASRTIERNAAQGLPPHTLMRRAGEAVARLARAWQPHARRVLVLAGGGNNGGDGWVAATRLHRHLAGRPGAGVQVWFVGDAQRLPADARWAMAEARAAGVRTLDGPPDTAPDLVLDALLGLGLSRPVGGAALEAVRWLQGCTAPTLCVDLPSGLDADSGRWWADAPASPPGPRVTLALLTLKPGLFTGMGRVCAGEAIWFADLGVSLPHPADAELYCATDWPDVAALRRAHASHKGSRGDVIVIGGQLPTAAHGVGMVGAALLAGRAALRAGTGRVYVGLLGDGTTLPPVDTGQPALMLRSAQAALAPGLPEQAVVVLGCGGGGAVATVLPDVLARAPRLVLDADALNALGPLAAQTEPPTIWQLRRQSGWCTVLTPHPLEAARLLGVDAGTVQADRLGAARTLATRLGAIVVLKGSGTVVVAPGSTPIVNGSGDGLLASAGTGDVLAGLIAARLAAPDAATIDTATAVAQAVAAHGQLTQAWQAPWPPTATDLIA